MWGNWTVCLALVCRIFLVIFHSIQQYFSCGTGLACSHRIHLISSTSEWVHQALEANHERYLVLPCLEKPLHPLKIPCLIFFDFSWDRPWLRNMIQRQFPPQEHWFQMVLDTGRIHLNHHVKPASGGSVQDCKRSHQKSLCHWLSWWLT